jgi:hypothetical protein
LVAYGTIGAIAVYGAARFGASTFYARLGTTPDAVGLDYVRTLSRVSSAVVLGLSSIVLVLATGGWFRKKSSSPLRWGLLFVCVVFSWIVILTLLPLQTPGRVISFVFVWLVAAAGYNSRATLGEIRQRFRAHPLTWIAAAVLATFTTTGIIGYRSAQYVMDGNTLPCGCTRLGPWNIALPWASGSPGFLGVDVSKADLTWVGTTAQNKDLPTSAIYLGTSDGEAVFYDAETGSSFSVPTEAVVIRVMPDVHPWKE